MSLQDFLDSQGKSGKTNGGSSSGSAVIDFSNITNLTTQLSENPKESLMSWGSSLFDSVTKHANDGYTLLLERGI